MPSMILTATAGQADLNVLFSVINAGTAVLAAVLGAGISTWLAHKFTAKRDARRDHHHRLAEAGADALSVASVFINTFRGAIGNMEHYAHFSNRLEAGEEVSEDEALAAMDSDARSGEALTEMTLLARTLEEKTAVLELYAPQDVTVRLKKLLELVTEAIAEQHADNMFRSARMDKALDDLRAEFLAAQKTIREELAG